MQAALPQPPETLQRPSALHRRLHRFNAAEGRLPAGFNRRRQRLLKVAAAAIAMLGCGWALYYLINADFMLAAGNLALAAGAVLMHGLQRRGLARLAGFLFLLIGLLAVMAVSYFADIPTASVPRTLQLYLAPLTVYGIFLLQHEKATVRIGLAMLTLLTLALLALAPAQPEALHIMGPEVLPRRVGALVNVIGASVLLYLAVDIMLREARESSALELDFARAVATGDLQAYLQPQCSADGRITGAEALMRWRHSERGWISPAEFIPMAERSGLIIPAGEQIATSICRALRRWETDPVLSRLKVSVNVSPAQLLSGQSAERLLAIVETTGAPRSALMFELTESMFAHDFQAMLGKMNGFRAQGIRMALDDFGTGFSSLAYLKQLPLDQLKVDQSFVRDLPADGSSARIASTIVNLGHDLGLELVAEGVEKREQLQALQAMGCSVFQGYLFGRPMPLEEFEELARNGRSLLASV
ncbi:EAL domain-containing protein [Pelomonas sp. SE-A7]|uniref:putative bifunctional diguanylate cyclase/phosphodiesterase n=1 Tax=Pelomonas sp. SE-A7 TaxID=3054953 RepID=UPI00259D23C5|nr:EAL domain-containing protein [Pelomonas sp. SE-A7]MDM4765427.1 EAL domain-containing protein [Pelomonas sp. SE-A7]